MRGVAWLLLGLLAGFTAVLWRAPLAEGCRVHRSGFVSVVPAVAGGCGVAPLGRAEGARAVRAGAQALPAAGRRVLATLLVGVLPCGPLLLLRRRAGASHGALAGYACSVAVLSGLAVAAPTGAAAERFELLGLVLAPTALAQLAMRFPVALPLLDRAPGLARAPAFAGAGLLLVGARILEVDTLLWPAFCALVLSACVCVMLLLVARCSLAVRESRVPLERMRSAALLVGLFLAVLPALLLLPESSGPGRTRLVALLLVALAVVPLPIGLSLSGYDWFDWRLDAERLRVRAAIAGLAGCLGAAGFLAVRGLAEVPWSLQSGLLLAATGTACISFADALGRRLLPRIARERRLSRRLAAFGPEIAELREERGVADRLAGLAREALPAPSGAVFSLAGESPRLLARFGEGPCSSMELAERARRWLADAPLRALWHGTEAERERAAPLLHAGVELVVALRSRGEAVGLLLAAVDPRMRPTRAELSGIASAAAQAGVALSNARLAAARGEAERRAATGRAALTLAHDLHKELAWVRRLARRIAERSGERERLARDAARIESLADERARALRAFVRDAMQPRVVPPLSLRACIERGLAAAARRLPELRSCCVLEEGADDACCDARLVDVVGDLVDNAARASAPRQLVLVHAAVENGRVSLRVRDRGRGLPAEGGAARVAPTSRSGGCGVGLALAREILASLGGGLDLEPARGGGTRARVELPVLDSRGASSARPVAGSAA